MSLHLRVPSLGTKVCTIGIPLILTLAAIDFAWGAPTPAALALKSLVLLGTTYICMRKFLETKERLVHELVMRGQQVAEMRESLVHAAKLAEMGNLVATTAHELAQPAQVISGMAKIMELKLSNGGLGPADAGRALFRINEASVRIIQILSGLKNFARKDIFQRGEVNLLEVVDSVRRMVEYDLRLRSVRFEVAVPEEPLWVDGDPLRLQQILLNFVSNARDACAGARLPIVCLRAEAAGPWARLKVTNTGPAIPCEVQERLFQRYFTTKQKGEGTGLGLSICAQLAELHGGRVLFSSETDNTTFVLDLPLRSERQPGFASHESGNLIRLLGNA